MRLFTDGAEFQDLLFWDITNVVTNVTTTPRSGNRCYSLGGNATPVKTIPSLSEFYFRFGYRVTAFHYLHRLPRWLKGSNELGHLRVNDVSGLVEIYSGGVLKATGSIPIKLDTIYLIELHVNISDTGIIEVKIEGLPDASFTGDTKPGSETNVDALQFIGTGYIQLIDDLALNDTTGGVDDSWCGDGKIILQTPNGAGDNTGLTPSAGSNYECVDEFPNDGDTTYVGDTVVDDYDLYNLTPCGLVDVDILRVWAEARARDVNAAGGVCKLGLKTEATEYWSAGDLSLLTSYSPIPGTRHTVNPNTAIAWTTAQLDALQAGFKVR